MSAIQRGDLVMVVRHCCADENNGKIATIERVFVSGGDCWHCHAKHRSVSAARLVGLPHQYRLSWLIKIDPPQIPESVERDEQVPA